MNVVSVPLALIDEDLNQPRNYFDEDALTELAENMQREGFTPIEEAEAFRKAVENPQWNMTVKFLAGKLGKKEKYISDKLNLLNFGNAVKQIIHNGT